MEDGLEMEMEIERVGKREMETRAGNGRNGNGRIDRSRFANGKGPAIPLWD